MDIKQSDIRTAATQVQRAEFNRQTLSILGLEISFSAIGFGCWGHSFGTGFFIWLVLMIGMLLPVIRELLALGYSIAWAVLSFKVTRALDSAHEGDIEYLLPYPIAVFAFIFAAGAHLMILQYFSDFKAGHERA